MAKAVRYIMDSVLTDELRDASIHLGADLLDVPYVSRSALAVEADVQRDQDLFQFI